MLAVILAVLAGRPDDAYSFPPGHVFVSVGDGKVQHFDPEGNLLETLDTLQPGYTTGMAFDRFGNLYVTNWQNQVNKVTKFAAQGGLLGTFGTGFVNPESIVFDSTGNAYVSGAGSNTLRKFDPQGNLLAEYTLATEGRGVDWIDLLPWDECQIFYTSEGDHVKVFDTCANTQLPDFGLGTLPPPAYALRILPTGGLLVATRSQICRLDPFGQIVQIYDVSGENDWFGLNLDPDGTSFWATSYYYDPANVYKFNIQTGQLLLSWPMPDTPGGLVGGIVISPSSAPIDILSTTTRWKPQRDLTTPIEVFFTGPADVANATLEITGPSGVVPNPTLAYTALGGDQYKVTWSGPWTPTLPRGDYGVKVIATVTNGTVESDPNDPNGLISLVEVTKVELCQPVADDNCTLLGDANPKVDDLGQVPPQERLGGGWRIFAEASTSGGAVQATVKVRATISPKLTPVGSRPPAELTVPVHFDSFDVDDPAPYLPDADQDQSPLADNRGSPAKGIVASSPDDVLPENEFAWTMFTVSGQPGDNYRVVASTAQAWIGGVKALQPNLTGEMDVDADGQPDLAHPNISDMLTVWRTLHIERDSMEPPTLEPDDPERNYIQGRVRDVLFDEGVTFGIVGTPEVTDPVLKLDDGSILPGRFEKGTICIGTGAAPNPFFGCTGPIVVTQLDGNGVVEGRDKVEKWAGITIPFQLADSSGGNQVSGNIVSLSNLQVTSSVSVPPVSYSGGSFTVGGVTWPVASAVNKHVTLQNRNTPLPFVVVDDDTTVPPYTIAIPNHLQADDDEAKNILAQAYVRPAWDLASAQTPDYNRNVQLDEVQNRLLDGRDPANAGSPSFWVAYLQGAFQFSEFADYDSDEEDKAYGITKNSPTTPNYGSLIFFETIYDKGITDCPEKTVIHEIGHQLTLLHPSGGIMSGGCDDSTWYFSANGLAEIRAIPEP